MTSHTPLTRLQMEILEFERATWPRLELGRRDAAILQRFGHSPYRHAQIVNHLLDQPAALAYDPQLVNRLRKIRDRNRAARTRTAQ